MKRIGWLLALGVVAGCAPKAETPQEETARNEKESAMARTAIEAANKDFVVHANLGHGDIVAKNYTEDGILALVNTPVAAGRQAIAAFVTGMGAMKPQLVLTTASVTANGPIAVERGTYSITITPPGATAPATESGTYLVHWHRVDGKWLMAEDVATSAQPLPPPPAAPAKK